MKETSFDVKLTDVSPELMDVFFGPPKTPTHQLIVEMTHGRWIASGAKVEPGDGNEFHQDYSINAERWEFFQREGDGFAEQPTYISLVGPFVPMGGLDV